MPDHWGYVLAAYGIALVVLVGYWRRLQRLSRGLRRSKRGGERTS
ncbi:MAG TPA: heme exporter protein CcmD [Methylomirabilota bacterium]|nr:heme exporter protein CcmD [Methylomirabilota bacterium]